MLKAKDLMTKNVISVKKDTPVIEAIKLLAEHDVTGVPVVEDDMTLIGVLSEKDLLKLFYNSETAPDNTVEEFMTQPAVHFDENESLDEVCRCLLNHYFRRVPVTSNGKVVGIISRPDIIDYILMAKYKLAAVIRPRH
jgi:CBS domain-containing protein